MIPSYSLAPVFGISISEQHKIYFNHRNTLISLLSNTLKDKPSNNDKSQGTTGMAEITKEAGSTPSTVDQLSNSWESLKKSVGTIADSAAGKITAGYQSALETVAKPVLTVVDSAGQKLGELAKNITEKST